MFMFISSKQGIALTGSKRTGKPCSVGHPTAHALDGRPARPPVALQTTTDKDERQTTDDSEHKTLSAH